MQAKKTRLPCFYEKLFASFPHKFLPAAHTVSEVITMASYVAPELREKFETLSIDLKNRILERNVRLETMQDFINVLEKIAYGK